jgi:ABC-2 type transport system permease protein
MNFKTTKVIIAREYLTRVKKKSFLVTTFLGPIFFAAICVLPSLIMFFASEDAKTIAVVDESGIVLSYLEDSNTADFVDYTGTPLDSLKAKSEELNLDVILSVSALDTVNRTVAVAAYSGSPVSVDFKEGIASKVEDAIEDYRLNTYNIDGLKQIMEDVKTDISISTYTMSESGEDKITSSEVYMIISLVLATIIYMFIAMFSGMVMNSVIEEKASRVVEVLVSSVKATELMFGKIIGVACVALTQFFLWIVLTVALVGGASAFIGFDSLMGSTTDQTEQMMQMAQGMGVDAEAMEAAGLSMADPTAMIDMSDEGEMGAVMSTLRDINYIQLIISFIVYFFLGYLLYASLFAAIGSAVENEADTQQLQMPVTIPLLLAFFIAFYAFKAPDSQVVFWGSMIPFTSPIVMLARIPFGVPTWELALSIVLLVATFAGIAYLSAKIYKIGILMYGKKTTFKDLYKWLRMK